LGVIWILLIASALLPNLFWSNLEKAKLAAKPTHDLCLRFFENSHERPVHQALVCGKSLSHLNPYESTLKTTSIAVGIYHVLVVSGAHLTFLEKTLGRLKTPRWIIRLILFLFAMMAHWDPPVVRALFESLIRSHSQRGWLNIFLSYLFSLALHPQWIHSGSLHLSIAARSALELPVAGSLKQAFLASLFLWPLIHAWSPMQFTLILLSVLTAEVSLAIWLLSTLAFSIWKFSTTALEFFGFKETLIHSLTWYFVQLSYFLVENLHALLKLLSRWQPHENAILFRMPQWMLFWYASSLLLITGLARHLNKKMNPK
jgi:hypothetical protein